jgi:hypothetical protein
MGPYGGAKVGAIGLPSHPCRVPQSPRRLILSMTTASSPRGQYVPLKSPRSPRGYPSPPHSNSSSESSLRALELSEGAEPSSVHMTRPGRSNSIAVFQFQADLLPLSLSEAQRDDDGVAEKTVGLFNGEFLLQPDSIGLLCPAC